jgi:hypothetical protein
MRGKNFLASIICVRAPPLADVLGSPNYVVLRYGKLPNSLHANMRETLDSKGLRKILSGAPESAVNVKELRIAKRESCSVRKVNMTISLAFLAPDLVRAAIEGRLPHGMGLARLIDLPAEWPRQYDILSLPA